MRYAFILPAGLLIFGCSDSTDPVTSTPAPVATVETASSAPQFEPSASYEEALASATAAIKIATENGYTWSTSTQLLKDAKSAAAEGDEASAMLLADEARRHAELAAVQAASEARNWHDADISD